MSIINAQTWSSLDPSQIHQNQKKDWQVLPVKYHVAEVDWAELPLLASEGKVLLPLPDGSLSLFRVTKASNFHPKLASKYPEIQTYLIRGISDISLKGRLDFSSQGIHAVIHHDVGEIYIDPLVHGQKNIYLSYFTKNHKTDPEKSSTFVRHEHLFNAGESRVLTDRPKHSPFQRAANELVDLSVFDLALSCTGEYTQKHGGTVSGALAAMNTALNRINFVLETELAIQLRLIPNNDTLIHLSGAADPFTNGNASTMAQENNNYLISRIGSSAYDVGHVFGTGCVNVVGVSGGIGIVCGSMKGFGSSCEISTSDRFYIGIVCHELGHQFGAEHTWNNCPTAPDNQFNGATAFEPGSGSTIMSYAGSCAAQNIITGGSDFYYHVNSIEDIGTFVKAGDGKGCAEVTQTTNHHPTVEIQQRQGLVIPISTPFRLSATSADLDGDILTYSWEQFDAGVGAAAMSDIDDPRGNAPIFRSSPPSEDGTRYFPALSKIVDSTFDNTEVLPTYQRKLTFRVTARDHVLGGGGTTWDEIGFTVSEGAGPFEIETFNVRDTVFGGDYLELKWDVSNTDQAPVNCKKVNILMSTDGGQTFLDTLLSRTPNDGSEFILMPDLSANTVRIMVAAADNIFFDINNKDIVISPAQESGFALDILPHDKDICLPEVFDLSISTFGLAGSDEEITISPLQIPEGVIVANATSIIPGEEVSISVDFSQIEETGLYPLSFMATSPQGDTIMREVMIHAISSDFSDLVLMSPSQGQSSVSARPTITWLESEQADAYNIQISSSPAFDDQLIEVKEVVGSSYALEELLNENTLYYWRLQPTNICGDGGFSKTFAFHTLNLSCETFAATDLPMSLSQSSIVTVASVIPVASTGTVSDVKLSNISGFHESFNNLIFQLKSPNGTISTLVSGECGFSNRQFVLGFDDESPLEFTCQTNFTGQIFRPTSRLDTFSGEEILGDWTLVLHDSVVGSGGILEGWSLELCGSLSPEAPTLLALDTLTALFGNSTFFDNSHLSALDDQASAMELRYTLVSIPAFGDLQLSGLKLNVGGQFTQLDIDDGQISYVHAGIDTLSDGFTFTIVDGAGGWIAPTSFVIEIDRETVSARDLNRTIAVHMYPNPGRDIINIAIEGQTIKDGVVTMFSLDGRSILTQPLTDLIQTIDIRHLQNGVYLVQIKTAEGQANLRLVVIE